jgi:glutaredoxin 2
VSVIESIVKELAGLPNSKLLEVARYVHALSEDAQKVRLKIFKETFGVLSEEDGRAFEEALAEIRHVDAKDSVEAKLARANFESIPWESLKRELDELHG